jgi:hypothetical protein
MAIPDFQSLMRPLLELASDRKQTPSEKREKHLLRKLD